MTKAGLTGRSLGLAILALPWVAGCPSSPPGDPDATTEASGLEIAWRTAAPIPGPASATLRIDDLHLKLSSVRAIGDAAPGDARTSHGSFEVEWGDDPPPSLVFEEAPAGLYSQLELGVGGGPESYELHGEVFLAGSWIALEVEDAAPIAITLPTSLTLAPGARGTITVTLDVAAALAPVDFAQVPVVGGELRLSALDPQIGAVRAALAAAFTADPGLTGPP